MTGAKKRYSTFQVMTDAKNLYGSFKLMTDAKTRYGIQYKQMLFQKIKFCLNALVFC